MTRLLATAYRGVTSALRGALGLGRHHPRAAIAFLALFAFVVVIVLLTLDDGEAPAVPPPPRLEPPAGASAEERLAFKHAPVVYLRLQTGECDRTGAAFEPIPVEAVLGNPEVVLRRSSDRGLIGAAPSAADLVSESREAFLDFPGSPLRPTCQYERDARRYSEALPRVAYAHIVREEGSKELVLQYWFFYYFNDWNNKHEGDWEMIQLVFEAPSVAEALLEGPVRVNYSQHGGGEAAHWMDKKVRKEGDRPVVHVAVGSQANFFGPHLHLGRAEQGAGFGCDDASGPSRRLDVEAVLVPSRVRDSGGPFAWLAYEGRWGELAGPDFDGPTGPNVKQQWTRPLTWEKRLRSSSVRVPTRDTVGPNAVAAFCAVIAFGSDLLLPLIIRLPLISATAMGAFGLLVLLSLTRTRYLPIQAHPLRGRRRIGQILLSAAEVYRRRARLFVGIGLFFVPATFIAVGAQWLVLAHPPSEPLVDLPGARIGLEVALTFALSELQLGLAYAVILAVATAAIGAIDAGRPASTRRAVRDVLARLPHVALPRLLAIVCVTLLSVTIVGLPLAVRQAVRWTFVEQAVLLDGEPGWRALQRSSAVVGVDWWWCVAATISLGLLGLGAAPALGIVLVLAAREMPLIWVNVISSAVYVALVPYVAICLSMVYFSLRQGQADRTMAPIGAE